MKTIKTLVIATLAVTTMSNAWSASKETEQEISAQTTITRGHIDNLLERINNRTIDTTFRSNDYLGQTQEFKNKVETALNVFEQTLEKDILPKASYWMDQYNAIYKSTSYSQEQKNMLLIQRRANLKLQFEKLSTDYQAALGKVYQLIPLAGKQPVLSAPKTVVTIDTSIASKTDISVGYDINEKVKVYRTFSAVITKQSWREKIGSLSFLYNGKYESISRSGSGMGTSQDDRSWILTPMELMSPTYNATEFYSVMREDLKNDLYKKYVYLEIKGQACKSQICLALRAGDYSALLIMVRQLLDRPLEFNLLDEATVRLLPLERNIEYTQSMLARVDYPEDLPFEF